MEVRLPMWVRFGPITPIITGLPLIMWQPTHPPWPVDSSWRPRSALPTSAALYCRLAGVGVFGIVHAGILSRGYATKPAFCTVPATAALVSAATGVAAAPAAPAATCAGGVVALAGTVALAGAVTGAVAGAPVAGAAGGTAPKAAGVA